MKINKYIKILNIILIFHFGIEAQNLRFSFEIIGGSTSSTIDYYVDYPLTGAPGGVENINSYTLAVFYDNSRTNPPVSFSSAYSNAPLGWNFDSSYTPFNANGSQPGYTGYVEVGITDATLNGTNIVENSGPILLGSLTFEHSVLPPGNALLADNMILGIVYTSGLNVDEFPIIVTGTQAGPLPITIKSFSATKDGERTARLDWTSSSEINSDYIGIERSTDGENWTTVGQVKAAGNSNRDIDYIYYDRSLPMARSIDNIFYYRLRLTDLDGQYKYSETRGVNMGRLEGLVSIYPNPATDIINVDLTDMDLHEGIIHLSVYDNTGKAIISKEVNGAGIEPIQASNMAAGSYQVVVKQGDTTHRKQIIVVN